MTGLGTLSDETGAWRHTDDFQSPGGNRAAFDLISKVGVDAELVFEFETFTAVDNAHLGWMIDDVAVHACPVVGGVGVSVPVAQARETLVCDSSGGWLDALGSYCTACRSGSFFFQWLEDGLPIPGATSVVYDIPAGHAAGAYDYSVSMSCPFHFLCDAESGPVQLTFDTSSAAVGSTLTVDRSGPDMVLQWTDVAGVSDYVVYSSSTPSGVFTQEVGSAPSGQPGLTVPLPSGSLVYLKVVGRNVCGEGPQG